MISHEHTCVHPPAVADTYPLPPMEKCLVVLFTGENGFPAIPTRHHVINRTDTGIPTVSPWGESMHDKTQR